jgi:hypothetical protein
MASESDDVVKLVHRVGSSVMETLLKSLFIGWFSRRQAMDMFYQDFDPWARVLRKPLG